MEPEPRKCSRKYGKRDRCAKECVPGHDYCDQHIHLDKKACADPEILKNRKIGKVKRERRDMTDKEFKSLYGRSPRIKLSYNFASTFFRLSEKLGHENDTIPWLLRQAEPAVLKAIESSSSSQVEASERLEDGYAQDKMEKDKTKPEQTNSRSYSLESFQLWKNCKPNQVWAVWDEVDGMPRLYARIHKLFLSDLKVEVSFMEPSPATHEETRWAIDKNLPMACGTFKEATLTTTIDILTLSHQVNCREGHSTIEPFHKFFPLKGEIWAVFKDWNFDWTLHDLMSHSRYEIVEVVSDLQCNVRPNSFKRRRSLLRSGDGSVIVIYLTRVHGLDAVFRRQLRDGEVHTQQFSVKELLRFSHRVPASELTGEELDGVPNGSWKLNSAAVPLHLLYVDNK